MDEEARRVAAEAREHAVEYEAGEEQELPPELEQRLLDAFREWRDA